MTSTGLTRQVFETERPVSGGSKADFLQRVSFALPSFRRQVASGRIRVVHMASQRSDQDWSKLI